MTDEDAFLNAIKASPDDDLPRLVFADWLDEHGQHERAEFIRVSIEAWHIRGTVCICTPTHRNPACEWERFEEVSKRESELLDRYGRDWTPEPVCRACGYEPRSWPFSQPWQFRRGFVHSLRASAASWLAHGDAVLAGHLVREVEITCGEIAIDWFKQVSPKDGSGPVVTQFKLANDKEVSTTKFPQLSEPRVISLEGLFAHRWEGVTFKIADTVQVTAGRAVDSSPFMRINRTPNLSELFADFEAAQQLILDRPS